MSEPKRIVFTTEAPNDQGGVIPNNTLDFTRYNLNPVILAQHVWGALPIGLMTDCQFDAAANGGKGEWTGLPVFNRITKDSQEYADMYEGGWIKASSIGGEAEWKTNTAGQLVYDSTGNKVCEKFILYEISIVTLPSNHQAVTKESYATKIYTRDEIQQVNNSIVTLASKYRQMETTATDNTKKTPEQIRLAAAQKELTDAQAAHDAATAIAKLGANGGAGASSNDPSIGQLPAVVGEIVRNNASLMDRILNFFMAPKVEPVKNESAPAPKGEPTSKVSDPSVEQPTPIGLTSKQEAAKKKAEASKQAAEEACKQAASAKDKAETEGAKQEDKDDYAAKFAHAEACVNAALEAEDEFNACMNEAGMSANAAAGSNTTTRTTNAAGMTPTQAAAPTTQVAPKKKTLEELQAEQIKLAPKPEHRAKVVKFAGVPFTQLTAAGNEEGQRLLGRVMTGNGGEKDMSDYQVILESLLIDDKHKAIVEKTRIITTSTQGFKDFQNPRHYNNHEAVKNRGGISLQQLAAKFQRGMVDVLDSQGILRETSTLSASAIKEKLKLNSTDNLLASPDLFGVEWLTLAIFTLYPTNDWKADIPMFGAEMTSKNAGLIWANVAADPAVTFGTQPVDPADYQVDDEAVALTLIPSWLQPMVWTPLTMHQLRYDKMAVQWAQAFAKWGALIDDKLLYTLASLIPASSYIYTIGQSGQGGTSAFTLTGANDPNAFYWNPNLLTSLAAPAWADIIRQEQLYAKQNFELDRNKIVLVTDPTMDRYIDTDPDTKSLLTRFTQSNPEDVLKIKHTKLVGRSRIAAYDPASGQVKDPTGALPAGTVSAGVGFIPSQVGMGLGILDVFMIQDPSVYGFRMSADIREGLALLRQNGNGALLYTYGAPVNP